MDEMARALERRPPLRIPVPLLTPRLSLAVDRTRDAGRRRRREAADRGPGDRDDRHRPLRDGACSRSSRRRCRRRCGRALSRGRGRRRRPTRRTPGRAPPRSSPVSWNSKRSALITAPASNAEADEVEPDQGDEDESERAAELVDVRLAEVEGEDRVRDRRGQGHEQRPRPDPAPGHVALGDDVVDQRADREGDDQGRRQQGDAMRTPPTWSRPNGRFSAPEASSALGDRDRRRWRRGRW